MVVANTRFLIDCPLSTKTGLSGSSSISPFLEDTHQQEAQYQHIIQNKARSCLLRHKWFGKSEEICESFIRSALTNYQESSQQIEGNPLVTVCLSSRQDENDVSQVIVSDIHRRLNSNNKLFSNVRGAIWWAIDPHAVTNQESVLFMVMHIEETSLIFSPHKKRTGTGFP
jgi:hypothetical protein